MFRTRCLAAALLLWAGPLSAQTDTTAAAERAPVVLRGDTLFWVVTGFGSVTPTDRARLIVRRLELAIDDPLLAGVVITYMRPYRIGDRVKIADTTGDVIEHSLLVTRVRTVKHVEITIPNSMVLGTHITNYTRAAGDGGIILHTSITIGYDAPWRQIHELLIAAAMRTDGLLPKPAPFVLQTALDDFYVRYEINAYTQRAELMARIYSDLHQNIQDEFQRAGVQIMSPNYEADPATPKIPPVYVPRGPKPTG